MLVILDGWGINENSEANAVAQAHTPAFDDLWARYPHARLLTHGQHVGLSQGQMGNSNVGHLNLGAGRIVYQTPVIIDQAIADGSFFNNPALLEASRRAQNSTLHLMGLFSDGGVHSHWRHLLALWQFAQQMDLPSVKIHCFLDGRDVPPRWAERTFADFRAAAGNQALEAVATVSGRYYAMDRDERWERTFAAYAALVDGQGFTAPDPVAAVRQGYDRGETDEFIQPTVITDAGGQRRGAIQAGDVVIFFNFRADRARQLVAALAAETFSGWSRTPLADLHLATMSTYVEPSPYPVLFPQDDIKDTFGEVVSRHGLRQLRLAETEKYAHVTYFFNGGREEAWPGEERVLVPSPAVATYDLQPEMSAAQVTDQLLTALAGQSFDTAIVNYANPDMVGHTGDLKAAIKACEAVDAALQRIVPAVLAQRGALLILADHGNAEQMTDAATGGPHTAHTTNPVPVILVADHLPPFTLADGVLANAAATLLELLGIKPPQAMTHGSLIRKQA